MSAVHSEEVVNHPTGLSIAARPLLRYPWLRHGSTTRHFGMPDSSRLEELHKVTHHLGVPASFLAFCEQKHTNNVAVVSQQLIAEYGEVGQHRFVCTDGLICTVPGVTISIMTADCAPVFLVDPAKKIIGLVHAGWKGTLARIATRAVSIMQAQGSDAKDIVAWTGPMAGPCCYEVSEELIEQFRNEFSDLPSETIHQGRHLDLVEINFKQLVNAGLVPENVHRSNLCTIHESDRFYSYRANNGTHGRIISAMVML